jgi:hypothetical protein
MCRWLALIFGNIWMLPNTIVSGLYLGVFALLGWVRFARFTRWAIVLYVPPGCWLSRRGMEGWNGWASGVFIIVRDDRKNHPTTIKHEERHVLQQMVFGILQPILYILASVFVFMFMPSKHSYFDNPFEIDARKAAGQLVDIPKSMWWDPNDRWAWW